MAKLTNFPADLDTNANLPDIGANDAMDAEGIEHDVQHTTLNQAVIELQKKVGVDDSSDSSSHDWRISALESGSSLTPFLGDDELQEGDKDVPTKAELILQYVIDGKVYGIPSFYIKDVIDNVVMIRLTIDKTKVLGSHTDYPCYVDLSLMPNEFWDLVTDGGGDIRCYLSHNKTGELPREVVSCDVDTETGELHVLLNEIGDDADKEFYILVDGVSEDYEADDEFGSEAVWSDYVAVWHGENYFDSTANKLHGGLHKGTATIVTGGALGKCISFNATGTLNFGTSTKFRRTVFSAQYWRSSEESGSLCGGMACGYLFGTTGNNSNWEVSVYNTNAIQFKGGTAVNGVLHSGWNSVVATFDGSTVTGYQDGVSVGSVLGAAATSNNQSRYNMTLGDAYANNYSVAAKYDEVRISTKALSSDWIATEYANQSNPATFFKTIETVED